MSKALFLNESDGADTLADLRNRLTEARGDAERARSEYGEASAAAHVSGNTETLGRATEALRNAQQRVSELEAALDYAQRALDQRRAEKEAEEAEARRKRLRGNLRTLTKAAGNVDDAFEALGRATAAARSAMAAVYADATPEMRMALAEAGHWYRHCLTWHIQGMPGFHGLDFISQEAAVWAKRMPDPSNV